MAHREQAVDSCALGDASGCGRGERAAALARPSLLRPIARDNGARLYSPSIKCVCLLVTHQRVGEGE